MSSSSLEDKVKFEKFWVDGEYLYLKIRGRTKPVRRHKSISSKLASASAKQLAEYELLGNGEGVSWLALDEDLSAAFLTYPEKFAILKKKNVA